MIYRIQHPLGLKLLTRLRLPEQHWTNTYLNIILKIALTHFVLGLLKQSQVSIFPALPLLFSSPYFFLNDLNNISPQFLLLPEDVFVKTLLYGDPVFDESDNQNILQTSIRYILHSKRFSGSLL